MSVVRTTSETMSPAALEGRTKSVPRIVEVRVTLVELFTIFTTVAAVCVKTSEYQSNSNRYSSMLHPPQDCEAVAGNAVIELKLFVARTDEGF